jgi:predicted acyltransferase
MHESNEPKPAAPGESTSGVSDVRKQRLRSLDAYRGLIMVMLSFTGFGLAETAARHLEQKPDSQFWTVIDYQFRHVQWLGCTVWDMIQPSFMFMVGVAMAYSYAKRRERGDSYRRMMGHAAWRSLVLVLLGVFLSSNWSSATNWTFANVLCQIGLGYFFLFLLWGRSLKVQSAAAAGILVGTWLLFVVWPGTGIDLEQGAPELGVTREWANEHLDGVPAAWHKNANVAHGADVVLLNVFPREEPFEFNRGGYQTLNFVPALATMLFGLMCGELLRRQMSAGRKLLVLIADCCRSGRPGIGSVVAAGRLVSDRQENLDACLGTFLDRLVLPGLGSVIRRDRRAEIWRVGVSPGRGGHEFDCRLLHGNVAQTMGDPIPADAFR